jgi:hypothetical protein
MTGLYRLLQMQEFLYDAFEGLFKAEANTLEQKTRSVLTRYYSQCAQEKPALFSKVEGYVQDILSRRAIRTDELVDLLTLQDRDVESHWFSAAVQLIRIAKDIPDYHVQVIMDSIWRRGYLHTR